MSVNLDNLSIIVADDHPIFRKGVVSALKRIRFISAIHEAADGNEVIELLGKHKVDLVLMDISMPGMDGEFATRIVRKQFPKVKIVALTMHDDEDHIDRMYKAGVNGYLLKNTTRAELEKAIEKIMDGKVYNSQEVSAYLVNVMHGREQVQKESTINDELSKREIEIMIMICQEMTSREIAAKLFLSNKTIDKHRTNILKKTDSKNMIGLIKYVLKNGIDISKG